MLIINRVKIKIMTEEGEYGFDEKFKRGLNFVASDNNTKGKSSILIAIYYCLGFEEIIGGVNEKVLTSVYKNRIEDGNKVLDVLESGIFLEISNGEDIITIYRSAKMNNRDSKLITVYYDSIASLNTNTKIEEFYVHMKNAAINDKGFHSFLEKFLHITLPKVESTDERERKLYLQLIFSAMFIEQKHGWSGILSGMPYLGIKDSKTKVIEFILGLDTYENEKKKHELKNINKSINERWNLLYHDIDSITNGLDCKICGIPKLPQIMDNDILNSIYFLKYDGENISIETWIKKLENEYENLNIISSKIVDNFDKIEDELHNVEKLIKEKEFNYNELENELLNENYNIKILKENIEVIKNDIINNKDAEKLCKLGSELDCKSFNGICPVCNQGIKDTLLPYQHQNEVMSIKENIVHLEAQKKMLDYSLISHENIKNEINEKFLIIKSDIIKLRRIARSLRNDLYTVDGNLSESEIRKKILLEEKIERLYKFKQDFNLIVKEFSKLSSEWKDYLVKLAKIPKQKFTLSDEEKLKLLKMYFAKNLELFRYTSISNIDSIEISKDNYLPVIAGFDMKFDSSASDNIRAIWAYTISLMETSLQTKGNHFNILIFDEPAQHSIGSYDMQRFFESIIACAHKCQVIIGITMNNSDIRNLINSIEDEDYNLIHIRGKAIEPKKQNLG